MRVLFTVPPLAGHVNPTVAVGSELAARGHEIAWTGPASALAGLLPARARILPAGEEAGGREIGGTYAELHERWRDLRGVGALRFLWEEALVPLARAMVPGVTRAVHSFEPDVLVADQQALAGPLVARRLGVPWATSASTSAELTRPFADFPKVGEWVAGQIAGLVAEFGPDGKGSGEGSRDGAGKGEAGTPGSRSGWSSSSPLPNWWGRPRSSLRTSPSSDRPSGPVRHLPTSPGSGWTRHANGSSCRWAPSTRKRAAASTGPCWAPPNGSPGRCS